MKTSEKDEIINILEGKTKNYPDSYSKSSARQKLKIANSFLSPTHLSTGAIYKSESKTYFSIYLI